MLKRGEIRQPTYAVIGLLVSAFIVITMGGVGKAVASSTNLERDYAAKDIALLLDTIYASPGDLEYFYTMPERFDVSIKDNLATVRDKAANLESSYYFASSSRFTEKPFEADTPVRALRITKTGGTITAKGVYDEYENEAIRNFQEFLQFIKSNKDRHYDFKCREEFEFKLNIGYYAVVSKNGDASLFYESEIRATELSKGKAAEFRHLETGKKQDFFIAAGNWRPSIALTKSFNDRIIILNEEKTKTWLFAQPSIEINQLPRCEAQELAGKRR